MTNAPLRELIDPEGPFGGVELATAVRFQLGSRHYPPIHPDFDAAAIEGVQACAAGRYGDEVSLPNGKVLIAAEVCDQLHLWPLAEMMSREGGN